MSTWLCLPSPTGRPQSPDPPRPGKGHGPAFRREGPCRNPPQALQGSDLLPSQTQPPLLLTGPAGAPPPAGDGRVPSSSTQKALPTPTPVSGFALASRFTDGMKVRRIFHIINRNANFIWWCTSCNKDLVSQEPPNCKQVKPNSNWHKQNKKLLACVTKSREQQEPRAGNQRLRAVS